VSTQSLIDWTKPALRIVYLVEGVFRDSAGGSHFVRWCGPPERAGSGFSAYPTLGPSSVPSGGRLGGTVSWEARLSRCSYEATLGGLKQHIQAISQVSLRVAIGDSDNPTEFNSVSELRDMALNGRWMGQPARLILVDADDLTSFEVVAAGTWDRDPNKLGPRSFSMTIDVGELIPPTLDWPMFQVPSTPDDWVIQIYSASTWIQSPNGSGVPPFRLNPDHPGLWLGQTFGGATHSAIGGAPVWREVVPYGVISTADFAIVSPRFDQFAYDLVVETTGGLVKVGDDPSNVIRVFNNNDPAIGPVGTCVKFSHISGFAPTESGHRVFAKVAGGRPVLRPAGYSDIGPTGDPELGSNIPGGGEASPTNTTVNPLAESGSTQTVNDIFTDSHFLGDPSSLHPNALVQLHAKQVALGLPERFRNAAVPLDLAEEPISYRLAIESLMMSIPADLVLRSDSSGGRKYFFQDRLQPGQSAQYAVRLADLSNADLPPQVTHLDDPDGWYSNDTGLRNSSYYYEPVIGTDLQILDPETHEDAQIVDLAEQSDAKTGQTITALVELDWWRFESLDKFRDWARFVEASKSRPQKVIEATHGWRSMRFQIGESVEYRIDGVYSGPGQIRTLRMDLDSQTVMVRSYHQPIETTVTSSVDDKGYNKTHGFKPEREHGGD